MFRGGLVKLDRVLGGGLINSASPTLVGRCLYYGPIAPVPVHSSPVRHKYAKMPLHDSCMKGSVREHPPTIQETSLELHARVPKM